MRILLLIPALNAGGAERVMVTLANEWAKTNDVTIMVFNDGSCFYTLSDKVHIKPLKQELEKKGLKRLQNLVSVEIKRFQMIKKEIEEKEYDFILSFCYTTNIIASLIAGRNKEKKIFISERNDPNEYTFLLRCAINQIYRKCFCIICQNVESKKYFENKGLKNKKMILPNPVNLSEIPQERPKQTEKTIVTVGRLIKQKNHALLIEAFYRLSKDYPEYNLKIYGIGPLRKQLDELIDKYDLRKRVFLMGAVKHVMNEVNKASIFVLPSNFEGFPNVLIEAMATGLPVISSNFKTGTAAKLIKTDKNGYLFRTNKVNELEAAIRKLLNRTNEYKQIEIENKKIAYEYREELIADRWLKTIVELMRDII